MPFLGLVVAFGVMLSFAASDFIAKRVSVRWGSRRTTVLMLASSLATMLAGAYFFGLSSINYAVVELSLASGIVYAAAGLLLYKTFETEQVSNTVSLAGIEYAIIIVLSVLLLGESVTVVEAASFAAVFVGVFLVTTARRFRFSRGYVPAMLAMVAYAIAYMLLVFASRSSGGLFAPLIINRVAAVTAMMAYVGTARNNRVRFVRWGTGRGSMLAANMLVGVFNGIATILLLFLSRINFIAVGSAIASAEPALVIFLGYLIYKERFERHQVVGFTLLVMGTVALSAV